MWCVTKSFLNPLAGARVTINNSVGPGATLTEDKYEVEVSRPGFKTRREHVNIVKGKMASLSLLLEAEGDTKPLLKPS